MDVPTPVAVYPSKRDTWLAAVMWISPLLMVAALVAVWAMPAMPLAVRLIVTLTCGAGALLTWWIMLGTRYTLDGASLRIRSGPFRWEVPLASITAIYPTRNPLSSPALSLDRLRIRYTGSRFGIMISPVDQQGFLRDLAARAPGIVISGGAVRPGVAPETGAQ
ncbi:MAG: PH domain-containing protein [Gammaproteobacteria bacterium]